MTEPAFLSSRARCTRFASAALIALVGNIGVWALTLALNRAVAPPAAIKAGESREIALTPAKPPPKRTESRPPPRRAAPTNAPRLAAPALGGGLSGLSFGLAGLDGAALGGDVGGDLVGAATVPGVMTEDAVDTPPRPSERRAPAYPARARARNTTGEVVLSVLIGTSGDVEAVKVLEARPPGVFEEAAQEAVAGWRFSPAQYKGRPVKVWARQVVRFELGS